MFSFFPLTSFFSLWGFNGYKEWIIQLQFKELQVLSEALRKGDKRLRNYFFLFQKDFFWVRRGGWDNSTPFQRRVFLRDWERCKFFFGLFFFCDMVT